VAQVLVAGGVLAVIAAIDLVVEARRRAAAPAVTPAEARVGEPVWEAVGTRPPGGRTG
jgi:hypothetical protein